ncbi:MAG: cupredoxin domain-containing protein [Acidimicrobiia bacterium]
MRQELRGLAALTAATLLLAACGGSDSGAGTTTSQPDSTTSAGIEITVTATEFKFEPDPLMVPADTEVTITLVNNGVVEHDITIDELDFHMLANPGETVSETITIPAGIYMVYCAVPGHHEAGMMVELIASG